MNLAFIKRYFVLFDMTFEIYPETKRPTCCVPVKGKFYVCVGR